METNAAGHPKLSKLLELWQAKRGARAMPARADFDVLALRPWLGNIILIDVANGGQEFRVRLHGSSLAWPCGDLTGKSAAALLSDEPGAVTMDCARVIATRAPLFACYRQTIGARAVDFGAIILPLSDDNVSATLLMMAAYAGDAE